MAQIGDFVFRHGNPTHIDYTSTSGDVADGSAVLLGNLTGLTLGIADNGLVNNVQGALALGGVWNAQVDAAYSVGQTLYKPAGNAILTSTSTNNSLFGFAVQASGAANDVIEVMHHPYSPA